MHKILTFGLSALFACSSQTLFAQEPSKNITLKRPINHLQLPLIDSTSIKVDGVMDEAVWQQALKVELNYETNPGENTTPSVKTEVYLFENGDSLQIGFKAFDSNPENIRAYLSDRDDVWDSDLVGIKFDTFNESRKAFQFFANAIGVQADSTQEDFRGDDQSWNAIWDSKGRVTEDGYVVEMAIPFKALRFPESDTEQTWGVEILRFLPRDRHHRIANAPVDREIPCQICQFDKLVGFSKIKPSQNLQLVPTLVVGQSENRDAPSQANPNGSDWQQSDTESEMGLNVRWGITQDVILNATINPDFSQVEADSAQLDVNNTFSIFVPEKRPFFLDGANYFNTPDRLLNTRNIIAPDYGVKVTGQTNSHSFGVFSANDQHTSFLLPGSQGSSLLQQLNSSSENTVVRYSKDLGNKNNLGVLLTDKRSGDYFNQVASFDGKYWFDQNHSVTFQYMQSDSEYSDDMVAAYDDIEQVKLNDDAYSIEFRHDSRAWWSYILYKDYGQDFRADLGFIGQVGFDKKVVGLGHRWFPKSDKSWWTRITLGGDWDITKDSTGLRLEEESEINLGIEGSLQSNTGMGYGSRNRFYENTQARTYEESYLYIYSFFKPSDSLRVGANIERADAIAYSEERLGEYLRISPEITWQINQHWRARLQHQNIDFDLDSDSGNNDLFDARITNFRLTYQIDILSFIRFTHQDFINDGVEGRQRSSSNQLLYSYKINPQTLFFAGYSNQARQNLGFEQQTDTGKNLFMKFSYAWQM
jgi:hypothetical protein